MSYEYQKDIKEAILEKYKKHPLNVFKRQGELDQVYAMAERVSKHLRDLDFLERNLNECLTKAKAFDEIAVNIKALRKHMLDSGRSVNAKSIETENTIKHIEKIIEGVDKDD